MLIVEIFTFRFTHGFTACSDVKSHAIQCPFNQTIWYIWSSNKSYLLCLSPDVKVFLFFSLSLSYFMFFTEYALENGDTEMSTEEPWDQKEAEPDEEEPGGGDRGPEVQATPEELPPGMMMEEEEEMPAPKVPPTQSDAPRKEHVNVVFIGHVGQFIQMNFHYHHCPHLGAVHY